MGFVIVIAAIVFMAAPCKCLAQGQLQTDLLIRNGRIVDGTGAPWFAGDVAIADGRIIKIGRNLDFRGGRTIDAQGMVVAPGFIDMMGQSAASFLKDPNSGNNLLSQGVTTILTGEGLSDAPVGRERAKETGWRTMREFLNALEKNGLPMNVAQTAGHTQVRRLVIGDTDRAPKPSELSEMRALVQEAMEAGAIGVSTALIYPPAVFATTEEITALCQVAGRYGGRYYTHMRNEGDRLIEAIDEALHIGAEAGTPVHIFHLKAAGRANWGKTDLALARIHTARLAGQEVDADIYPYVHNGLGLDSFIHPRHFAQGEAEFRRKLNSPPERTDMRREMEEGEGWENWFRHCGGDWDKVVLCQIRAPAYRKENGKSLGEIARVAHKDPWDVFWEIVRYGAFALPETMSEGNKIQCLREDFISICTDVGPAGGSTIAGHPRAYGSYPRVLAHYVRELNVISLERAVSKMSALAANQILAHDRGRVAEGQAADLVIFDANTVRDRATFAKPDTLSEGIRLVIVNGQIVFEGGKRTNVLPGRVLRGPGFRP